MTTPSAIGLALTLALAPALAHAGLYREQVESQISLFRLAGLAGGWAETHSGVTGTLRDGASTSYALSLNRGVTYKIFSVCDQDCSDLDLTLYDENNNRISVDTKSDAYPYVEVTPRWTGAFTLRVKMEACRTNPCDYGVLVLGK